MEKQQSWLWPKTSISSHSTRYFNATNPSRQSHNEAMQSPVATSKASFMAEDKLKGDAKVVDEATVGWEKAEMEIENFEVQTGYLETTLKECLRQLRQAKDKQEMNEIAWESTKGELEKQICDLQAQLEASKTKNRASHNPNSFKSLEEENALLKQDLMSLSKELEIAIVERNLSTKAAETASRLQLESIKRVANLEAECQRLQSVLRKFSPDSFGESCLDCKDSPNVEDIDASYSGASTQALISELNQFNDRPTIKGVRPWSLELEMMDDFLETEVDLLTQRIHELEKKLEKMETEKSEAISAREDMQRRVDELQKEVHNANEANDTIESQLVGIEAEARSMSVNVNLLEEELEQERSLSAELRAECQKLKNEVVKKGQEAEEARKNNPKGNGEPNVKQEDVANKLVECQKTIASLGMQLKSLATLDDFLVETKDLPGLENERFGTMNNTEVSKGDGRGLDHGRVLIEGQEKLLGKVWRS